MAAGVFGLCHDLQVNRLVVVPVAILVMDAQSLQVLSHHIVGNNPMQKLFALHAVPQMNAQVAVLAINRTGEQRHPRFQLSCQANLMVRQAHGVIPG